MTTQPPFDIPNVTMAPPRTQNAKTAPSSNGRATVGIVLVAVAILCAGIGLLGASTQPSGQDARILADRCSSQSQALSAAEKDHGAKSVRAGSARAQLGTCRDRLELLESDGAAKSAELMMHFGLATASWIGALGILILLAHGDRITRLGESARVRYRAVRGLPSAAPTITLPSPEPEPQQTPEYVESFRDDVHEEVVDYPEDEGDADADDAPRARSGWGGTAKRKLDFGDEDGAS